MRFNPCETIHYVVNALLAPPGALDDLLEAIRRLEAATGLVFVNDGPTDEPADATRRRFQPERYGNRWAPVLVVWDHGARFRMEPTDPAGGRSSPVNGVSVTGVIVDLDAMAQDHGRSRPASGFGEGTTLGRVILHELGHLVGLGHVAGSEQIMFPELDVQAGVAEYQAGDLRTAPAWEGGRLLATPGLRGRETPDLADIKPLSARRRALAPDDLGRQLAARPKPELYEGV